MHWFIVGTAALLLGGLVVCGAVATRTGWLLPWLRRRVLRPELWGYGTISFGTGLLLMMSYGSLGVFDSSSGPVDGAFLASMVLMAAGGYLQALSTRQRLDG
ncbi:hypothetical protein ACH4TV_09980 [Streptomyces sp. NPDC020898]|uniref:hypothetical protein n=1 Tax=Streptomyces sp. NPDC020898 TaxID=3365101 RepID=UPI00379BEE26